ncbi:MAG: hypothetical protein ACD_44C00275G0002 [uncultured bacterium]|nr:MAG: hypothetical protein ACD_44C00275G0002 [uncultured bacterium]OGT23638.1 MAG: hypothetical protein A2W47_00735 [Gammaproteobacteria bacterium RIFCSPHIGHO2_12_38_15]OGT66905.1 MAG: hypothetical protein A3I12_02345 [Gammaproteobacteria bacterium RIFCSPLOWO2_02_FULL_38_11]OGT77242.1 MAG: hypothetical protein A3G71_01810 [Gammaproteobacteria bacterium RIFCSPLOWO2_12_FULL_38_14]
MAPPEKLTQENHITIYIWEGSLMNALMGLKGHGVGHASLRCCYGGKCEYFSLWPKGGASRTIERSTKATSVNCQLVADYESDRINEGAHKPDENNELKYVGPPRDADHKIIFYDVHFDFLIREMRSLKSKATPIISPASSSSSSTESTGKTELQWAANPSPLENFHYNCCSAVFSLASNIHVKNNADNSVNTLASLNVGHHFRNYQWEDYFIPNDLFRILEDAKLLELHEHQETAEFDQALGGHRPSRSTYSCTML